MSPAGAAPTGHPIRVVARRTGLSPDLIRAWERRYHVVEPERGEDNQRFYSDADIRRLSLLRRATEAGRKISRMSALDDAELARLVADDTEAAAAAPPVVAGEGSPEGRVERMLAAAASLDSPTLAFELERAAVDLGPADAVVRVVAPLLERLAAARAHGELRPMHEKLGRTAARAHLSEQLFRSYARGETGPVLLAASPEGQRDDLGALLPAVVAAADGWRVTVLGAGLSAEDMVAAARQTHARAVALGITEPPRDGRLELEIAHIRRHLDPNIAIVVAGPTEVPGTGFSDRGHRIEVVPPAALRGRFAELRAPAAATGSDVAKAGGRLPGFLVVSAVGRDRYGIGELETADGRLDLGDVGAMRSLAHRLNRVREVTRFPERGTSAGQIGAAGVLLAFWHGLLTGAGAHGGEDPRTDALAWLDARFGRESVNRALDAFVETFHRPGPPSSAGEPAPPSPSPSAEEVLEGLLLVWLANRNPAFAPLRDLFDDEALEARVGYRQLAADLEHFFAARTPIDAGQQRTAFDAMLEPLRTAPGRLDAQLEVALRIDVEVGGGLADRFRLALDVLREEHRPVFVGGGPPEIAAPPFAELAGSPARYSPERGWMASLVLGARHALVWLDQLSRAHGRPVDRLDQVPDDELARLSALGINGLWLVGVWQRSRASQAIKREAGNPEAGASAYSLEEYRIADSLGGEAALEDLRERALAHGIRLGCDVVANHMGLDSTWMIEHPERFLSVERSPFPSYTFTGSDLSPSGHVGIYIADQYRDGSDAPVVFQRVDRSTGETRYVYHGNDGTSLPWNDTAQLDYLRPDTREAMIQTILSVAKRFSIIRFDAAMTLARQHFHRLWYPSPGMGGAIPSRAGHGITREQLDRAMPREFWREVVERVLAEAPDTLLLAEAFWLMEGFFVRTVGMHRVYNSAFMHLMRDESNVQLRTILRDVLAFDPGILERWANFLTTPDERPAAEQFGKGDKYFGACTLLATLPGLPLLGHGQIEGLTEKYGMEYLRAYYSEGPDPQLVARHKREITPLLRGRARVAHASGFRLLDLERPNGIVDDNVLAWVTRSDGEATLVMMHNRATSTRGRLLHAAPVRDTASGRLISDDLLAALGLDPPPGSAVVATSANSDQELAVPADELRSKGWPVALGPYEYHVLTGFRVGTARAEPCRPCWAIDHHDTKTQRLGAEAPKTSRVRVGDEPRHPCDLALARRRATRLTGGGRLRHVSPFAPCVSRHAFAHRPPVASSQSAMRSAAAATSLSETSRSSRGRRDEAASRRKSSCSRTNASRSSYCPGLPETSSRRTRAAAKLSGEREHSTSRKPSASSRSSSQPKSTSRPRCWSCHARVERWKRSTIHE